MATQTQAELERDVEAARRAAIEWFADEMEMCPRCGVYVPWEELEALIGTPPICLSCRYQHKWAIFEELKERWLWPLGLS